MTRTGTAWRRAALVVLAIAVVAGAAQADDAPPANNPAPTPPSDAAPIQIGRSILVVKDVDGQLGDAPAHRLKINDDIVFSEDITTGADAKTVIEFRDGSTFEIGADAVIRIDSFIFNPEESTSHKAVQVTRGVFRYVSGYVASDQDTKITTPAGEMGIRGSVVEGIVDPSIPDFVYVGEGNATFTNGAGSSDLVAGASIAVPSATTLPMAAASMPAAVAAQAVQVIERRLPPRSSFEAGPITKPGSSKLEPRTWSRSPTSASCKLRLRYGRCRRRRRAARSPANWGFSPKATGSICFTAPQGHVLPSRPLFSPGPRMTTRMPARSCSVISSRRRRSIAPR